MGKNRKLNKAKIQADKKRRGLRVASLLIALTLTVGAWVYVKHPGASSHEEPKAGSTYVRRETKPTLSPALFVGRIETAYQVANDMPDLIDQLYCYCECDKHSGHRSLLSCYTDQHAANCDVCVNEALHAARLAKQGYKSAEIRREIDRRFSRL